MTSESLRIANALLPLLTSALGSVHLRPTPDSVGLALKGTVFGLVSDGALMFRVDAQTRADYDAVELDEDRDNESSSGNSASSAFAVPGGASLAPATFRRVPSFVLNDEDTLAAWGRKAWEAAKRGQTRGKQAS